MGSLTNTFTVVHLMPDNLPAAVYYEGKLAWQDINDPGPLADIFFHALGRDADWALVRSASHLVDFVEKLGCKYNEMDVSEDLFEITFGNSFPFRITSLETIAQ